MNLVLHSLMILSSFNGPFKDNGMMFQAGIDIGYQYKQLYVESRNTLLTDPSRLDSFNPKMGTFIIEAGVDLKDSIIGNVRLSLGHQSQHGIGRFYDFTRSHHYAGFRWKIM